MRSLGINGEGYKIEPGFLLLLSEKGWGKAVVGFVPI
jgi:hypothetical protein